MTNASPPPTEAGATDRGDQHPRPTRNDVLDLGRLRRSNHERRIAGVAAGLARHLDIDPIIVRVTLVVLVFFGGAGLLLYGAVWLLAPEEGSASQPLGLDDRNRGIALIGTGILAALAAVGDFAGAFWFPWPLVIIGLLVVWFLHRNDSAPTTHHVPTYPGAQQSYPHAPGNPAAGTATGPAGTSSTPGGEPTSAAAGPAGRPGWQTRTVPATPSAPYGTSAPSTGAAAYTPYLPYDPAAYARPRNPRKKGPILFWFTLALIATGIGTLGVIDVAGTEVPSAAYPALALALTGAMLVLGAFWGRAGGLILIGLGLVVATLTTTASANYLDATLAYAPTTSAEVRDSYDFGGGELVLDLSGVQDRDELGGRDITLTAEAGEVEVIVPAGIDVTAIATTGVGEVSLFDEHTGGFDINEQKFLDGGDTSMRIIIDLGVGQVTVREQ